MRALPCARAAAVLAVVLTACAQPLADEEPEITDPAAETVRSANGVVASADPRATEAGARVLADGGNAADAAVATAFALTVVEPTMSGIAGRASIVVRTPDGEVHGIDGLNTVPAGFQAGGPDGYERVATPGALAAFHELLRAHGTMDLGRVMEPAIELARDGFVINELEAERIESARDELRRFPGSRQAFLDESGEAPEPGETVTFPDYARVLEAVADKGIEVFYQGWVADSIHADMERNDAFLSRDDLAAYEAREPIQVTGRYQGKEVVSNYLPSSGHTVIQALQTLEALERVPGPDREAEWASVVGQAMQLAMGDRRARPGGTAEESARRLTSSEWARERSGQVAIPGPAVAEEDPDAGEQAWVTEAEEQHTSHHSTVDRDGMAVALTQSLGPSLGTRVVTPGLGFPYATRLGSAPGSRPASTIAPTIVLGEDGEASYVLGAAADARIITSIVQILSRALDHGASLEEAMAAPRVHPDGNGRLLVQEDDATGWSPEEMEAMEALGFELDTRSAGYFGWPHAIQLDRETGEWIGVVEPHRHGGAAAPLR